MTTAQAVPASAATTGVPAITAAEHGVMWQAATSFAAAGGMPAGMPELTDLLKPGGPEAAGITSPSRSFYERGHLRHLMVSSGGNEQEPAAGFTMPQARGRGGFTAALQAVPASAATTGVPAITAAEHEVMRQAAASFAAAAGGVPAGTPELADLLTPGGPEAAGVTSASRAWYQHGTGRHLMVSAAGNEQKPTAEFTTQQAFPASAATTGVPAITAAEHEVMWQAAASFAAAGGMPARMPELADLLTPGGPEAAGITSASRDVYRRDQQNQGHLMMMASMLSTEQVTRHGQQMRVAS